MSELSPMRASVHLTASRNLAWRAAVVCHVEELVRLEPGWDGYRGRPVSLEIARFALRLLEAICSPDTPEPQIVPVGGGEIQIEWHEHNTHIELFVRGPNDVAAWRSLVDQAVPAEEEVELTDDFTTVAGWLTELTERACAAGSAAA